MTRAFGKEILVWCGSNYTGQFDRQVVGWYALKDRKGNMRNNITTVSKNQLLDEIMNAVLLGRLAVELYRMSTASNSDIEVYSIRVTKGGPATWMEMGRGDMPLDVKIHSVQHNIDAEEIKGVVMKAKHMYRKREE